MFCREPRWARPPALSYGGFSPPYGATEQPMEMHQIRYFLAVADELNFTRAATKCNVSQPSLTRAIKLLEEELGGALFHRERANTHLSELGRMVMPHLQQVYGQSQAAKQT